MRILLSPAKRLHHSIALPAPVVPPSLLFPEEVQELTGLLQTKSPSDLKKLMKISDKVASLNAERFRDIEIPIPAERGSPALFLFNGDAYQGLDASHLQAEEIAFAQKHLRILSGLYGLLRPLDRILPYRLEMGTKLAGEGFQNLYEFWGERLAEHLNTEMAQAKDKSIINLASKEYFSALPRKALQGTVYTMHFKEYREGKYKFITYYGKKARGLLARFIIKNKLEDPQEVKYFDLEGYHYNAALSVEQDWVFTRGDE